MFTSSARFLLRRAPFALAAAGGASLVTPPQFSQCSQPKNVAPVTIKTGKEFVKLFIAEYTDANKNVDMGKEIDLNETKTLLEGAGGKVKHAKEIFDLIDADCSGSISYSEIVAYFLTHAEGSHDEKMSFLFHACDVDFSGRIEPGELKVAVHNMMTDKMQHDGKLSVFAWHPVMYADIPERYIVHLKANEFVNDVFSNAARGKDICEKEFIAWHLRGGKQAKRLDALFGLDRVTH